MSISNLLVLGKKYSKADLATILLDDPDIKKSREGIYYCKQSPSVIFFVDLEKEGKEERFHFNDFFDGDFFHWDSQSTQHLNSPKLIEIINGKLLPHLFVRIKPKLKSKTQRFVYCGRLEYLEYEAGTSKPVHLVFQNTDYSDTTDIENLLEIYSWSPEKSGKTVATKITKKLEVSEKRKVRFQKPNNTERKGLVTTRVGQGYYRQQIIKKWGGICPITKCDIREILISSHIVPWSESNDDERLDIENGILLSPVIDALFDKHLISFNKHGNIMFSEKLSKINRLQLGLSDEMVIPVNPEMLHYLKRHQTKFYEKN